MTQPISREELRTRLSSANSPVLVEALPEKYYVAKHLPGALHLPHDQVDTLAARVLPKKSARGRRCIIGKASAVTPCNFPA